MLATLATAPAACGAPEVATPPPPGPGAAYAAQCKADAAKHAQQVADNKYIPFTLVVHQWPGRGLKEPEAELMKEQDLAVALAAPATPGSVHVRTALVLARGGTGKSTLAESLTAQGCDKSPFFRLDLNLDVIPLVDAATPTQNPIAVVIARQLGEKNPANAEAAIKSQLGDTTWVAVLDSLDETPLLSRDTLARHIDDLVTRVNPKARAVVLTRPPVFNSNYGIGTVDARIEIPQLNCAESDAAYARYLPDEKERKPVDEFVKRYGLDRKVSVYGVCHYPHLATYRDLQVVQKLAKNAATDAESFKNFQNSRAEVYRYFIKAQLLKDLQGVALTPDEAIATVDAMVANKKPDKGERNLPFLLEECVAAATVADTGARQSACERLLQSALFKGGAANGQVHFANQSLGDLFLARWVASQLKGDGGKTDCHAVDAKAMLLESNEVAGFLVGQPEGQQCLTQIARAMCKRSGYAQHIYEQFDQGLPSGKPRAKLVASVLEDLKIQPKPDLCVSNLAENLAKTVEALPAPEPEPAAKDAKPAKPKPAQPSKGK